MLLLCQCFVLSVFCRLSQIEDILSSVKPAKNYLTKILKKIHDDLLC